MGIQEPTPAPVPPESEAAAFERLKGRLVDLWTQVFPREDVPYTSVIVPSISVNPRTLAAHPDALRYEEMLLFLLIRLRNPRARVVYVTSQPVPGLVLDYYLHFLMGIPASHAAARLTMLSAHDGTLRPLSEKILERPRLVKRIRAAITDPSRAYLTVLRATPLERRLALALDLPLNGADPALEALSDRSSARRLLEELDIEQPAGALGLRDEEDLLDALACLRRERPSARRAVVKLERADWDEGHALVQLPESASEAAVRDAVRNLEPRLRSDRADSFLERFDRTGGTVSELIEEPGLRIASVQVRANPLGKVTLTSTHDELREGPGGGRVAGCLFPADDAYRPRLQELGLRVGRALADKGLMSGVSIEFAAWPDAATGEWRLAGVDLNLGTGGATHPILAVRFLTGGGFDGERGVFLGPSGRPKHYRCLDEMGADAYRSLLPEDLVEILTESRLHYSHRTESGALFYMIGGIAERGRVGIVAIGNGREEADTVFCRTAGVLDAESRPATAP